MPAWICVCVVSPVPRESQYFLSLCQSRVPSPGTGRKRNGRLALLTIFSITDKHAIDSLSFFSSDRRI